MKKGKNCDCITKVRQEIAQQEGENLKYIDLHYSNIANMQNREAGFKTGQGLTIVRKHKRKDGRITEKREKTFIGHDFCPFCGQQYN